MHFRRKDIFSLSHYRVLHFTYAFIIEFSYTSRPCLDISTINISFRIGMRWRINWNRLREKIFLSFFFLASDNLILVNNILHNIVCIVLRMTKWGQNGLCLYFCRDVACHVIYHRRCECRRCMYVKTVMSLTRSSRIPLIIACVSVGRSFLRYLRP